MNILNFSNQIGAGPRAITTTFLRTIKIKNPDDTIILLPSTPYFLDLKKNEFDNLNIIFVPSHWFLRTVYLTLLLPIYTLNKNIQSTISFGNFAPLLLKGKHIVLIHHPYLYDDKALSSLKTVKKILEKLKRLLLRISSNKNNIFVVQTENVKRKIKEKYNIDSTIIPNPLMFKMINEKLPSGNTKKESIDVFYPSRFYPHKNHKFIIDVIAELKSRNLSTYRFIITVDENIHDAKSFIESIKNEPMIVNIGEVKQDNLKDFYINSQVFAYFSETETYGNTIGEASIHSLPLLLPNYDYAHDVAGNHAIYYKPNDRVDFVNKLIYITDNHSKYCALSNQLGKSLIGPNEWVSRYLILADINTINNNFNN